MNAYTQSNIHIWTHEIYPDTCRTDLHSLDGFVPDTLRKKIDHDMLQKTIWCSKAVWDTTYSELPANRSQLLNPSVKCITTEDTIKLLSLFPNSNFSKQVSHICTLHTPSHPSILDRCIHVQVSTTIVQVISAHLKVPTTFFMYLH